MIPFKPSIASPIPWATAASYPAGAFTWSGQPTKVVPAVPYWTPGEHPAAEEFNAFQSDNSLRLKEAKADLEKLQRQGEITSLKTYVTTAGANDAMAACCTASGRTYMIQNYNGGGASSLVEMVGPYGLRYSMPGAGMGTTGGNLKPSALVANGELVLACDSPLASSTVYNCDTDVATALTGAGATRPIDAATLGTGWIGVFTDTLSFGGYTANATGPRVYTNAAAQLLSIKWITNAGVCSNAGASAAMIAAPAAFGAVPIRLLFTKLGSDSRYFFCYSGWFNLSSLATAAFTLDGGATWTASTLPDPYPVTNTIVSAEWCPLTSMLVLSVMKTTETKIYTSADYGATWNLQRTYTKAAANPATAFFAPIDLRRMASGLLVATGYPVLDQAALSSWPILVSEDGIDWHVAGCCIGVPAGSMFTISGQDMPFGIFSGGSNGWFVSALAPFSHAIR